jgi:hypothetical protein
MSFKNLSTITTTANNNSTSINHQLSNSISLSSNHSSPPKLQVKVNPYIPSKIIYNKILQKLPEERREQIKQLKTLNSHLTIQQFIKLFLSQEKQKYIQEIEEEEYQRLHQNIKQWDPTKYKKKVLKPGDEDYKPPESNVKQTIEEKVQDYIYKDNCYTFKQPPSIENVQQQVQMTNMYNDEKETQLGLVNKEIKLIIKKLFQKLNSYKHTDKIQLKVLDYTFPLEITKIVYQLFTKQISVQEYTQKLNQQQKYLLDTITKFMTKPKPVEVVIQKQFKKLHKINPELIDKDIDKNNKNKARYYSIPNRTKQIQKSLQYKQKCQQKYKINKIQKKLAKQHHKLTDYEKQMYEAYYDPLNYI